VTKAALTRLHVFVEGRVQGVCFRYEAQREATRLGIQGWARNLPDGRVEAVYEGQREAVEEMLTWTQHGPEYAHVATVHIRDEVPRGESGFNIS